MKEVDHALGVRDDVRREVAVLRREREAVGARPEPAPNGCLRMSASKKHRTLDSSVRRLFPLRLQSLRFLEESLAHVRAWILDDDRQKTGKNLTKLGAGRDPCLPEIVAVDDEVAQVHRLSHVLAQTSAVERTPRPPPR